MDRQLTMDNMQATKDNYPLSIAHSPLNKPLVSVCIITYNHAPYIAQTLDSVLAQKTDFPFEIVIGEDASPDSTRAICKEYEAKYPHIIRVLDTEKNMGVVPNFIRTAKACEGKYIAVLEGDDYWIDDYKLQKQAEILEEEDLCVMCFTGRKEYYEATDTYKIFNEPKGRYDVKDFAKETFFHLSTVLFRKPAPPPYFDQFLHFNGLYDRPLYVSLLADSGGYAYKLMDIGSIYRHNIASTFVPLSEVQKLGKVIDMYVKIKEMHPQLGLYMNYNLNKFDYFIMRQICHNPDGDMSEVRAMARQILARPTIPAGWWLKMKAFIHLFM
jgi:glycosyltransferase involved in cell wall biosynthesis